MNLTGILVPLVTPFKREQEQLVLDVEGLKDLVNRLLTTGVAGFVVCGTTGEYYALSHEERNTVLKTVAELAKGKATIIAGINHLSTQESCLLAQEAKDFGYDGLMLSAPAYSLPCQEGVLAHFKQVADATDLPMILYNFPDRVGVEIAFETVVELAKHPRIVGIKESSGDFSRALRLLQEPFESFEVVCGCDDQPLDFFFWGAKSWIAGAANVFPEEQVAIFEASQKQDWQTARALMSKIYPAIQSMESSQYNQKAKLATLKGQMPAGDVRAPLANMTEQEKQDFLKLVQR